MGSGSLPTSKQYHFATTFAKFKLGYKKVKICITWSLFSTLCIEKKSCSGFSIVFLPTSSSSSYFQLEKSNQECRLHHVRVKYQKKGLRIISLSAYFFEFKYMFNNRLTFFMIKSIDVSFAEKMLAKKWKIFSSKLKFLAQN